MNLERIYMIEEIPGYSPQIGRLVSMMNYVRWTTLDSINGLTIEQLDYLYDNNSNSIGALLSHIAAVEYAYYVETIEKRKMTEYEKQEWNPAIRLGEEARTFIKCQTLDYYIECLNIVRKRTLDALKHQNDEWLNEYQTYEALGNKSVNNYFKWFHVYEDEINHRGQIRWLQKRVSLTV
ncbi:MAG: DinB family protein [Bacillota bacterium]